MSKVLIEVTEEDIKKGWQCSSRSCPIALAMKRVLNTGLRVTKRYYSTDFDKNFTLPPEAQEFIYKFDRGDTVQPFSFEVEKPDEV